MDHSPYGKSDSLSSDKEILCLSKELKASYNFYMNPPGGIVLGQMNVFHSMIYLIDLTVCYIRKKCRQCNISRSTHLKIVSRTSSLKNKIDINIDTFVD
jgi:hypothetical protein